MAVRRRFGWREDAQDGRDLDAEDALYGLPTEDPTHSDLTPYEPPITDQGSSNQCVGESVAAALAIAEAVARLPRVVLSARFPYYAGRRALAGRLPVLDVGSFPREVVRAVQKLGCPEETLCPRGALRVNFRPTHEAYTGAHGRRGGLYFRISDVGSERGATVRRCLAARLPVMFGMQVPRSYLDDRGPDVVGRPATTDTIVGRHMQVLVGHARDVSGWEWTYTARNSWGSGFRDRGRVRIAESLLASSLVGDLVVVVGHDLVRRRLDADPELARWRSVVANLEEARLAA